MTVKGVRVLNSIDGVVKIDLASILKLIDCTSYNWAILFFDCFITDIKFDRNFCSKVNNSTEGYPIDSKDLNELANSSIDLEWIKLIGSKNKSDLKKHEEDQVLYESNDIYIAMIDGWYWEIFTKDSTLYSRLIERFEIYKFIESDYQKNYYNQLEPRYTNN